MALFALTMINGPRYDSSRQRREQDAWDEHAAFMDMLVDDGFVFLGGPIGDGQRVLLVVDAEDERQIRTRPADDPWKPMGIIAVGTI